MSTLSPNLAIPTPAPTDAVSRANYNAAITAIDRAALRCFNPRAAVYGALFDGQFLSDGAITNGSAVLTSASGVANPVPWAPADVGKTVWVFGATTQADGHTLSALQAQILSYQGPGQVTLSLPATVSVSGAFVAWGTDDSTALQACINDAHAAYLQRGGGASYVFIWGTTLYANQLYLRDGVQLVGAGRGISVLLDAGSYTSFGIKPNEVSGVRASRVGLHKLTIQGSTGPCIPFHGNLSLSGDGIVVDIESAGGSESGIDLRSGARPVIRAEIHGQKVGKIWNGSGFTNAKAVGLRLMGGDLGIQQPQIDVQIHDTDSAGLILEAGHPGVPPNGPTTAPITGGTITASLTRVLQFIADADGEIDWAYGAALSQPQNSVVKITVDGCQNASDATRHSGRFVFGFLLDQGQNLCTGNSFELTVANAPHIDILNGACLQGNRGTLLVDRVGASCTLVFFRDAASSLIDTTTLTQSITASGSPQTVTVASTSPLQAGQQVVIGPGTGTVEVVTVTAVGAGTITAIFAQNHSSGAVVQPGPSLKAAVTLDAVNPQTVAVNSMLHMDVGRAVVVDDGANRELVTLTAVAPSGGITAPGTITAIFTKSHALGAEIKGGAAALDNTFSAEVADPTTSYGTALALVANTPGLGAKRNRLHWPRLGSPTSAITQTANSPSTTADLPTTGVDANHIVGVTHTAGAVDGAGLYFGKTRSSRLTIEGTGIVGLMGDGGAQHAQEFHVYDQWNDASNYRRLTLKSSTSDFRVVGEAIGTFSGSAFNVHIGTETATSLTFRTNAASRWSVNASGHLLASTDNAVDIGAAGATRPRNGFFAGAVATGVKAGAAVDGDVTNPTDGMLRVDSTNGRLYVRYGAAWHFVALT